MFIVFISFNLFLVSPCLIQGCLAVLSMPARLRVGQVRAVAWLKGAAVERSSWNAPGGTIHADSSCGLWNLEFLDLKHWHDWSHYSKHLETSRNIKHVQIFKNCQRVDLVDPKLSEVGQIPHILWNPLRSFESVQVASSPVEARNGTRCSSPSPKRRRNQADSPDSRAPRCHTEMSKTSHHSFVAQICCPSTMPPTWDQRSFDMILICFDIIR
jgi:hypothetical protein